MDFSYSEMVLFKNRLDPQECEQVGQPDCWTKRDVLAHLAEEHRWVAERLSAGPGVMFEGRGDDYEQINRDIWNAYRDKSLAEIMEILQAAQQSMLSSLEILSDEDLTAEGRYPWTGERPLWRYLIGIVVMHPVSHLCQQYAQAGSAAEARRLSDEITIRTTSLAAELGPIATYNQACILALVGDQAAALAELRKALSLNPQLIEWSRQDSDLTCLHGTPEFERLLEELQSV